MNRKNVALVTGASSGIGEALTRELISKGWVVVGIARRIEKLNAIKNEMGPSFIPMICDIADKSDIQRACQNILDQGLCPHLFFLNAGIASEKVIENAEAFTVEIHERIMAVNYFGVLAFVEFFEKPCLHNGGAHFIVTSSVNAIFAPPTGSAYCASKAAISKAFESLSFTYYRRNLIFSSIYTGPVATDGLKGNVPFTWSAEKMAKYMCQFSELKKSRGYPSLFYFIISHLLRILPDSVVMRILKKK
ncbi:MAG: 3-phenylpropionate-dihydrodiol/cinnamic acid-dihydrodiol dehydrogenase [Holosporales bacterium]